MKNYIFTEKELSKAFNIWNRAALENPCKYQPITKNCGKVQAKQLLNILIEL